jgi:glycosyltransferase involved in cell wall biosynthesis
VDVKISVVVPVRDDRRIDDLLSSLAVQENAPPFEVIVALDGSTREPRVPAGLPARLLRLPPRGAYAARNSAIGGARGEVILLTDSDCICPPDWIATAARLFEDPALLTFQGASLSFDDSRLSRLIQREYEHMVSNCLATGRQRFCDTRNFAIRTPVARRLPLPDSLPRNGDAVYGWQLEKQGVAVRYEPSWRVSHRHLNSHWREGRRAFSLGKNAALWWREAGFDFFASPDGRAPRGPGAWLYDHTSRPTVRRLASLALLPVAGLFAMLSVMVPGTAGARAFSRFRRAATLAGRLSGEALAARVSS